MIKIRFMLLFVVVCVGVGGFFLDKYQNVSRELFFVNLSKDSAKMLGFDYRILHNLYHTNNRTEILESTYVTNGSCKAVIGEPDGVYALVIEVFEAPNENLDNLNARIGISGEVLGYKEPKASMLIAKKVQLAYTAIMKCYSNRMNERSLLETM